MIVERKVHVDEVATEEATTGDAAIAEYDAYAEEKEPAEKTEVVEERLQYALVAMKAAVDRLNENHKQERRNGGR